MGKNITDPGEARQIQRALKLCGGIFAAAIATVFVLATMAPPAAGVAL